MWFCIGAMESIPVRLETCTRLPSCLITLWTGSNVLCLGPVKKNNPAMTYHGTAVSTIWTSGQDSSQPGRCPGQRANHKRNQHLKRCHNQHRRTKSPTPLARYKKLRQVRRGALQIEICICDSFSPFRLAAMPKVVLVDASIDRTFLDQAPVS